LKFYGNPQIKRNYIFVNDAANVIEIRLDNKLKGIYYASG
jgi:dTDP-D-glucose 4,6-dehydratase